ncbi:DEAD/DEAH box helicase family protein [Salipiger pacificus]|nr:DEAD/DEAH box helicase family protein [Alloyangia pacifica]
MTMQDRTFSPSERAALAHTHGERCADCGATALAFTDDPALRGHADHATSFADGGTTTFDNGDWLCGPCNLRKGRKSRALRKFAAPAKPKLDRSKMRSWALEAIDAALDRQRTTGARSFFVAAGVGSGKTRAALGLYLAGDFDYIIAVVPKTGIRGSWESDAKEMGINLKPIEEGVRFKNEANHQTHGYVLTAGMINSVVAMLANLCARHRVLVVVDEAHHFAEGLAWTDALAAALGTAAFSLPMSGTPYRADNKRLINLNYLQDEDSTKIGTGQPDFVYSYEQALAERFVAPVVCRTMGGAITHCERENGQETRRTYSFDDDYAALEAKAEARKLSNKRLHVATVFAYDWQLDAVAEARKELVQMTLDHPHPWGGLVVCYTVEQARKLAKLIKDRWGDKCLLIVDEADTARAVAKFTQDSSYRWAISITKVSEGISIDRLRVGVLLSPVRSQSFFEQVRGRLARLENDIPWASQRGYFFVPDDPDFRLYAEEAHQMILHSVPWLADPEILRQRTAAERVQELAEIITGAAPMPSPEEAAQLSQHLSAPAEAHRTVLGSYTCYSIHEMTGAVTEYGEAVTEEEWKTRLRDEILANTGNALIASAASAADLDLFNDLFGDDK